MPTIEIFVCSSINLIDDKYFDDILNTTEIFSSRMNAQKRFQKHRYFTENGMD